MQTFRLPGAAPASVGRAGFVSLKAPIRASTSTRATSAIKDGNKCVMFEVDGAIMDLHMDAHRVAFNVALRNIGFECVNFSLPVYNDLLSAGDGTAEGLVRAYFQTMGWPDMMATSDRPLFVHKVVEGKNVALAKLLKDDAIPLRDSVAQVIKDAVAAAVVVVFITGTLSDAGSDVVESALRQLGPDIASRIRVFNCNRTAGEEERDSDGEAPAMSMSQMIQAETNKVKSSAATAFAQSLKGANESDTALLIGVDNNLLAAGKRRTVTPELLATISLMVGVPLSCCVLVGANSAVTSAAVQAGAQAVAIPRKMAFQGSFPGVRAKVEGYGVGLLNWAKLNAMVE